MPRVLLIQPVLCSIGRPPPILLIFDPARHYRYALLGYGKHGRFCIVRVAVCEKLLAANPRPKLSHPATKPLHLLGDVCSVVVVGIPRAPERLPARLTEEKPQCSQCGEHSQSHLQMGVRGWWRTARTATSGYEQEWSAREMNARSSMQGSSVFHKEIVNLRARWMLALACKDTAHFTY